MNKDEKVSAWDKSKDSDFYTAKEKGKEAAKKVADKYPAMTERDIPLTHNELITQMWHDYKALARKDKSLPKYTKKNFIANVIVDLDKFQSAYNQWVVSDYSKALKPILVFGDEPDMMNDVNFQPIWERYVKDHKLDGEDKNRLYELKKSLARQAELILQSNAYAKTKKKM